MGGCCSREILKNKNIKITRSSSLLKDSRIQDIKQKYEYISLLGNGGFGKVKLYRDKDCKKMKYAIKTLQKNFLKPQSIKYLLEEVKTLREVDHPNIVKYFGTYEDDLFIHIIMEYIPGEDLFKTISQRKYNLYTEHDAAEIISHLLKAVLFLHNKKIIHHDLKPENILFSIPGTFIFKYFKGNYQSLKLIDFGLSQGIFSKNNHVVGSLHYLAPETLEAKYSYQVDSWSIGVILFVMMTGKEPFTGMTKNEVLSNIKTVNYDRFLLDKLDISSDVKDLISQLLVKDQKKRLTVEKALEHSWILKYGKKYDCSHIGREIIESMKIFSGKSLFQKEVLYYLARLANEDEIQKSKKFFLEIDKDNTGTIEFEEVTDAFKQVGIVPDPVGLDFKIF